MRHDSLARVMALEAPWTEAHTSMSTKIRAACDGIVGGIALPAEVNAVPCVVVCTAQKGIAIGVRWLFL